RQSAPVPRRSNADAEARHSPPPPHDDYSNPHFCVDDYNYPCAHPERYLLLRMIVILHAHWEGGTVVPVTVERIVEPPPCACGKCGGLRLRKLGETVSKTLECEPRRWK